MQNTLFDNTSVHVLPLILLVLSVIFLIQLHVLLTSWLIIVSVLQLQTETFDLKTGLLIQPIETRQVKLESLASHYRPILIDPTIKLNKYIVLFSKHLYINRNWGWYFILNQYTKQISATCQNAEKPLSI